MDMYMSRKQWIAIAAIVILGALCAVLILKGGRTVPAGDEHSHADEADHATLEQAEPRKGPHGGRYFAQDGFALEISIFEQGVEPEFRIHTFQEGKPLAPEASKVAVTLERLGQSPQAFSFSTEKDYLKGSAVVEEPHSFKAAIVAQHAGKTYRFAYEQIEARVAMSDLQLKQNGVGIDTAGPARLSSSLQLNGEIRVNQDRMVHIVPRLAGMVRSVTVNAGDRVRKGQLLAVISSQELADQRGELLSARKRLALARSVHDRERQLWQEKISAEQDYQQARSALAEADIALQGARQKLASAGAGEGAQGDLTRYEIRAPIDGTITEKRIAVGQSVKDDSDIFVVADLSTVWVEAIVPAKDINFVKNGQKAVVSSAVFDGNAAGIVSYVGALVGEQTRSAVARIVLPNADGTWRPGLPVTIALVAQEVEVPVAVATESIQTFKDAPAVFGRFGDVFEARPVVVGRSDGKLTEIIEGLRAGEQYAAKNSFLIKADLGKAGASHDH
jgi:membrane fusion protein, heavy metal efflux system